MNGNIFNYSLASEQYQYSWSCGLFCSHTASAIPPAPPANTSTTGEPIFAQSYINAYNTAFNQETPVFSGNYQQALNKYVPFTPNDTNSNFINGTFGYQEEYNNGNNGETFRVGYLIDDINNYFGIPYLFVSAGSGAGSGFIYLDWIIVTYGVPYVLSIS